MNLLKIITIFNWIVIAVLGFLVMAETLTSTSSKGGDAYGRSIGMAIYYLAIIAFVVLIILNLLPFNWAKYTALGLIVLPILFYKIWPILRDKKRIMQQEARYRIESAKPIFEDKEREAIARAIYEGDTEAVKKILQSPVARLNDGGEILSFVVDKTSSSDYKIEERVECIRLLFQAGARLDSTSAPSGYSLHMAVAGTGNARLLRLLLEQGADANAHYYSANRSILFEAVGSYQDPEATVRVLLEFGADPNAKAVLDDEDGPVPPLWLAAKLERWGVCVALLEKGADPDFKIPSGKTFRTLVQESNREFPKDGYTTQVDYDRLLKVLQ